MYVYILKCQNFKDLCMPWKLANIFIKITLPH